MRDAKRLLGLAVLPPGAVRVSAEPGGDRGLLVKPPQEPIRTIVDRYGWWRTSAAFDSVVAFLQAHPPPGATPVGSGGGSGPGIPANQMLSFSFPPISGVVSTRALTYYAVALRGGGTGVRVVAQETWIVPRRASERVPAGVQEVGVTSARPGMAPVVSLSVTSGAKVAQIISLIDGMPTLQPGFFSCPALPLGKPVVTFDFRGAARQPLLARARLTDYGFPSGPCNPVSFSVRGHRQQPLIGGDFLTRVERLLNVRL